MKFAFCLFRYYPFGGLERNFLNIVNEALRQGHEVHIFAWGWSGLAPEGAQLKVLPVRGYSNHGRSLSFVRQLRSHLEAGQFDLVVGFNRMPGLDLYYCADVCFTQQAMRKHSRLYKLTPRYRTFAGFEKAVFSPDSTTEIMFLSRQTKEEYQAVYGTPEERFHELPPGINKDAIRQALAEDRRTPVRQELGIAQDGLMLVMVGSDFKRKGVSRAIHALGALPERLQVKTKLVVIGKGKEEGLKRLAETLGVGEQVVFTGPRSDVPRFLAAADALLHLAESENTGNAIVEGLIAGLPVLVTRNCGYYFHVQDARAGVVVGDPVFDQEDFNAVLSASLGNPEQLKQWGKNALAYSDQVDLYSRPQKAVLVMEKLVAGRRR